VLLFTAFLALNLSFQASAAQPPEKVRVGYFLHEGYQNKSADGIYSGYGYDYLQKISEYTGMQYEFVEGSWAECCQWLQDGTIDMMGFMLKTREREAIYNFPDWNCGYNTTKLLVLKDDQTFAANAWSEMNGIRVGMNRGSAIIDQFAAVAKENGFQYTEKLYDSQEEVTEALQNKEVDTICVSNVVIPDWTRVISVFDPQPIYYAVAKGNTQLLDRINEAIGKIKSQDPTFEQSLRSKYYTDNYSQAVIFSEAEKNYIANSKPIKVAVDPDYLPIEGVDPKTGQIIGYTPALLKKISDLSGLKFECQTGGSYASEEQDFHNGSYDVLSSVNQGNLDSAIDLYSDTWLQASAVMVGSENMLTDTAHQMKIAVANRTGYLKEYVKSVYPDSQFVSFDTAAEALAAVEQHTVDLALMNIYFFQVAANAATNTKLSIIHDTGFLSEYHFAFHEDTPKELVSIMNKCINSISESESNDMLTNAVRDSLTKDTNIGKIIFLSLIIVAALVLVIFLVIRLRKSRKKLEQLAYYDKLTGTSNLNKFIIDAEMLVKQHPQLHYQIRVFDIRNFQMFNDFYGYEKGDVLLCNIVKTLKDIMDDKTETLGRINADQFIALTAGITQDDFLSKIEEFQNRFRSKAVDQAYFNVIFKTGCYTLERGDSNVYCIVELPKVAKQKWT